MTPLAHRIARELTLPNRKRQIDDGAGILGKVGNATFFDVSQAYSLVVDTAIQFSSADLPLRVFSGLAFLPNPAGTWIEYKEPHGSTAVLLVRNAYKHSASVHLVVEDSSGGVRTFDGGTIFMDGSDSVGWGGMVGLDGGNGQSRALTFGLMWMTYAALSIINSPRRINQRVVMMHRGLARDMRRKGVAGIFPANAYREITLHAMPEPVDASDAAAWRDYNSNRMPLHFVRAHRRREDGVLNPKYDPNDLSTWDLVEAHWRGNAAFGIKLKKYRVAA
jgi:hypothetical protein